MRIIMPVDTLNWQSDLVARLSYLGRPCRIVSSERVIYRYGLKSLVPYCGALGTRLLSDLSVYLRKRFASSAASVIGTIHPSYKPRGGIRFVITVTCPTCLFFARVLRPPLFTFALAGQLLTNVTFTY